jgi:predicted nucleic-acid-binding Zn-ribbon protein
LSAKKRGKSPNPDYAALKCPKCGNTGRFREYALTETEQPFFLRCGEPDFQVSEIVDSPNDPQEIRCSDCDTIVWSKET